MSNKELKIGDNKIIKHLAEISTGLMLAIGTGVVVSNPSVTSVQANATVAPVTATDFKSLEGKHIKTDRDTEMMPIDEYLQKTAEWNTVPNPYKLKGHNNIKFHWYKKAHVRNAWDNTDMHWSQAFSAYDAIQTDGKTLVSGTATVNSVHFYIIGDASQYEMAYHGYHDLKTSAYFEQPRIGYVTKSIPTYDVGTENSLISNDGYEGMVLSEGIVDIPAKHTILIPSHHDPVELFGTEYVPIIFTNHGATGGTLIKYSDFKKYVKSGKGHKFLDNGYINYQKNNHVYSKENDVKYSVKYESRKLKSAKRRKAYEKAIISDLKYDAKMQHKYGLA